MAKTGRPKAELLVSESERAELVRLRKRAHVNRHLAFRARLVLGIFKLRIGVLIMISALAASQRRQNCGTIISRLPTSNAKTF